MSLTMLLGQGACSRPATVSVSADSTAAFDRRVLLRTTATERLMAIRARLDSLEGELPRVDDALGAGVRMRVAALGTQRDSLSRRVRGATEDEWLSIRLRVADVLDSLEQRIGRLSDELRRRS